MLYTNPTRNWVHFKGGYNRMHSSALWQPEIYLLWQLRQCRSMNMLPESMNAGVWMPENELPQRTHSNVGTVHTQASYSLRIVPEFEQCKSMNWFFQTVHSLAAEVHQSLKKNIYNFTHFKENIITNMLKFSLICFWLTGVHGRHIWVIKTRK